MMITSDHRRFAEVRILPHCSSSGQHSFPGVELADARLSSDEGLSNRSWLTPLAAATLIGVEGKKEKGDRHPQAITLLFYINHFFKIMLPVPKYGWI